MKEEPLTIHCSSPRDLVEHLRQLEFQERPPGMAARFVFRGQGDASWGLVPSAFRPGTTLGYENREFARIVPDAPTRSCEQGNAEYSALSEFLTLADQVGLEIPGDHPWLRRWNPFNNVVGHSIGSEEWPPEAFYQALAVAQHHGVPTRLLDFTFDPLVAAFFAAESQPTTGEQLAVWCVDCYHLALAARDLACSLRIVTVPKTWNSNLAAQKGLFVLDVRAPRPMMPGMEHAIAGQIQSGIKAERLPADSVAVRKYCLPTSQSDALLDVLRQLGIDQAHLMPSFAGVVRELEARRKRHNSKCGLAR